MMQFSWFDRQIMRFYRDWKSQSEALARRAQQEGAPCPEKKEEKNLEVPVEGERPRFLLETWEFINLEDPVLLIPEECGTPEVGDDHNSIYGMMQRLARQDLSSVARYFCYCKRNSKGEVFEVVHSNPKCVNLHCLCDLTFITHDARLHGFWVKISRFKTVRPEMTDEMVRSFFSIISCFFSVRKGEVIRSPRRVIALLIRDAACSVLPC